MNNSENHTMGNDIMKSSSKNEFKLIIKVVCNTTLKTFQMLCFCFITGFAKPQFIKTETCN